MKIASFHSRTALAGAVALALGAGNAVAGPWAGSFCMFSPGGGPVSDFSWGTVCDEKVTGAINGVPGTASLASPQLFFGFNWTAKNITTYGPGTYTFNFSDASGTYTYTFTVGTGQVGATMLFDWSTSSNIGVVNIYDLTPGSGTLTYTSTDWDGDGILGGKMINGPFAGFSANFNMTETLPITVTLITKQGGNQTSTLLTSGGNVTVDTGLSDPSYTYDWTTLTDSAVTAVAIGGTTNSTLVFDPSTLSGKYSVGVKVDVGGTPVDATTTLNISPITLGSGDSDGDGVADNVEGAGDSDGDGIPDFLDNSGYDATELAVDTSDSDAGIMSSDAGTLALGSLAASVSASTLTSTPTFGPKVTADDIGTEDDKVSSSCVGGCFDFKVTGLSSGQTVNVVIPLSTPIPDHAVYRKYDTVGGTWSGFSRDGNDAIASAAATAPGQCPAADSSAWTSELTPGDTCIRLTLTDGGDNDADGVENGTIVDPGGVAEVNLVKASTTLDEGFGTISGPGCTLGTARPQDRWDLWLLLAGLAGLGVMRRKSRA